MSVSAIKPNPPSELGISQHNVSKVPDPVSTGKAEGAIEPTAQGSSKRDIHSEARQAIEFLNRKTNRNWKPSPTNLKLIIPLLRDDGYTLQELKCVVAILAKKWTGTEWQEFLRPATIFGRQNFNSKYAGLITGPVVGDDREPDEGVDIS